MGHTTDNYADTPGSADIAPAEMVTFSFHTTLRSSSRGEISEIRPVLKIRQPSITRPDRYATAYHSCLFFISARHAQDFYAFPSLYPAAMLNICKLELLI